MSIRTHEAAAVPGAGRKARATGIDAIASRSATGRMLAETRIRGMTPCAVREDAPEFAD